MLTDIALLMLSGLLYHIGGSGYKWVRRYVLAMLLAWVSHSVYVFLLAFCAFSMPYGDDEKFAVNLWCGFCHSVVSVPVCFGDANVVSFLVVMVVMYWLGKKIAWGWCEALMGMSVMLQVI